MGAKVTFDSANRLIVVTAAPVNGIVNLDVQVDLYSDMKEDLRASDTLASNPPAFLNSEGGVPTATGYTGQYFFLNNEEGWRIQPYDSDHELYLVGNLFPIAPAAAWWVSRPGRTIMVSREFSNLAQGIDTGGGGGATPGEIWSDPAALRVLGLLNENAFTDNTAFDGNGQVTSMRVRLFNSKTNCDAASDGGNETTGLLHTYLVTAVYEGLNKLRTYKMTSVP